ncbi:MAG: DUF1553 domain-containing protein [Pirellulaceae bacterium]|nr:DUF1553 domain-containing protein [Pirellulaceae bacterium]
MKPARHLPPGGLDFRARGALVLALGLLAWWPAAATLRGDEPRRTAEAEAFFERQVRPLLVRRCDECHGELVAESELRVDTLAGLVRGGQRGPAIVPGQAEESLLIRAIRHGELLKMPPKEKLPLAEIAILAKWIQDGAAWPGQQPTADSPPNSPAGSPSDLPPEIAETQPPAGTAFWAFAPLRTPALPDVRDRAWVQSPVDVFILARLEAAGLRPAPAADKATLARRASFVLRGLPPTIEELAAFQADSSPDAFARLVDRWLASPQYGERWGRHWLDVARYADSNGLDENLAHANAYRYRDYVVNSLNRDKPYDRFVSEQIAGDLLPPSSANADPLEPLVGTGLLCIGPKMLAEDDPVKLRMDIVDEQLDTLGRAFLGMTFGCARCHDHKFDPLSMADYYALAGILHSTRTMDTFTVVAQWHERPLATPAALAERDAHQRRLDAARQRIAELRQNSRRKLAALARRHLGDYLLAAENARRQADLAARAVAIGPRIPAPEHPDAMLLEAEDFSRGNVLRDRENYGRGIGVLVNQGQTPNFVEYDVKVPRAAVYQLEVRYAAAAARPCRLLLDGQPAADDLADGVTGSWFPDSQRWEVEGFFTLSAGQHVLRLEQPQFFPHIDKLLLVPIEGGGMAAIPPLDPACRPLTEWVSRCAEALRAADSDEQSVWANWHRAVRRGDSDERLRELAGEYQRAAAGESTQGQPLVTALDGVFSLDNDALDRYFPAADAAGLRQLQAEEKQLQESMPQLPTAMAVEEGAAEDLRLHYRGSHLTLGPVVPRRFPRALSLAPAEPISRGSGRLQLAAWLTSGQQPLVPRVLVNRLWLWHFGEGLVRTPDNFGQLGQPPTHPELLDWLAVELVRSGWQLKDLHRTLLLSSTWQMSTAYDQRAAERDPENRLWWRRSRLRLEAEAIRDGLLAVAGNLDLRQGGSLLPIENRKYVTSTANVDPVVYQSNRRSLYLPVVRSALYDVFAAFDFAEPSVSSGQRQRTTVAPQALFMMNSDLVAEQTRAVAERLLRAPALDDAGRVWHLYLLAYARPPDQRETERALEFVAQYQAGWAEMAKETAGEASGGNSTSPDDHGAARLAAWQSLCRAVLAANEFVYLE